jgi:hypothetical protein
MTTCERPVTYAACDGCGWRQNALQIRGIWRYCPQCGREGVRWLTGPPEAVYRTLAEFPDCHRSLGCAT